MRLFLNILLFSCVVTSCIGMIETDSSYVPTIVVEGRIEEGGGAEIQLTRNISYTDTIQTEELQDAVIRWAKVTLTSDKGESEVLTGYRSDKFPAGFGYRSNKIIGEVGVTYSIKVEYSGITLTADTTIPERMSIDSLVCHDVTDTTFAIMAYFQDLPSKNAYLVECKTSDVDYYSPAFLGIVDDNIFRDSRAEVAINRPIPRFDINQWQRYFLRTEDVKVRISNVGRFAYKYWSCFENEALNASNPIFPADNNMPSNIVGANGKGIWAGYNSCYLSVNGAL